MPICSSFSLVSFKSNKRFLYFTCTPLFCSVSCRDDLIGQHCGFRWVFLGLHSQKSAASGPKALIICRLFRLFYANQIPAGAPLILVGPTYPSGAGAGAHSWIAVLGKEVCTHMEAGYQPLSRQTGNIGTNSDTAASHMSSIHSPKKRLSCASVFP